MKVLFLFLVTVATMLCSTGRLQIPAIHRVNLISVFFMKHSLLLLQLLRFLACERFLLYRLSNYFYNATIMLGNPQTSPGRDAPVLIAI